MTSQRAAPMDNVIAGRKPVLEALKAGTPVEKIVLLGRLQGAIVDSIRNVARTKGIDIDEVSKETFVKLAGTSVAQGVVAIIGKRRYVNLEHVLRLVEERQEKGFILVLDEIEDPHNLGALVRTAECAGVHGVIIPKHHAAPVTSAVVKASAGATEHVAIAEVTNVVNTIEQLKTRGYWIIGLDAAGSAEYTSIDYLTPVAVVVGNEGKGIRRLVKQHCDHLVRIPLHGTIESLNASVAGALVMYEVVRQRRSI